MRRLLVTYFLLLSVIACGQSLQIMTKSMIGPLDTALLRAGRIRVVRDSMFSNGSSYSVLRRYELDQHGRIGRIETYNKEGTLTNEAQLGYDNAGGIQKMDYQGKQPTYRELYSAQAFQSRGRTDSILFSPEYSRIIFRYDNDGRLLEKEFTLGPHRPGEKETTRYQYDSLGRISIVEKRNLNADTKPQGYIVSLRIFQYSGGRLVEETETIKGPPQFTWTGTVHYKYDSAGRLVESSEENRNRLQYTYYPDGQLQRVREHLSWGDGDDFFTEHRYSYER
ncbi:MAG: hypothetical protein EOP50_09485 [Sphingobacteriales bacterium]|nr:MAG: hypothetical protein EOP50_09485 [Sphingobacteriales bacterium]